jgi:transcriptional regulator with XRE-family HTH domain
MDNVSIVQEGGTGAVNSRIAANLHSLRSDRGLSLDALAAVSGVSRSALSLIERAESSPTAVVLDKVAGALGVPLEALFKLPGLEPRPLARRSEQPVWRDPSSGYVRRSVSPQGVTSPTEIVEVTFPPGARVTFETGQRRHVVHEQLWLLEGTIEFTLGDETHTLHAGDSFAFQLDRPTTFHNPSRNKARYAVVLTTTT